MRYSDPDISENSVLTRTPLNSAIVLSAILVTSFILRSLGTGTRDLGLDEVFSFFFVGDHELRDLVSPFSPVITSDAHPPLFYVFTWIWTKTGYPLIELLTRSREYAFRFPYPLFGVLTTYTMYRTGKMMGGIGLGLLCALFHCISSFSVQICHQTRMYPMVEWLSSLLLSQWCSFGPKLSFKQALPFSLISILLFLTHYNTLFFTSILWISLIVKHYKEARGLIAAFCCALIGSAWWMPGLISQISHEASVNVSRSSTGIIVPFTLYHFFTGDRALAFGRFPDIAGHALPIASFIVGLSLFGWLSMKRGFAHPLTKWNGLFCVLPLALNWLATFKIQRVFGASYYAIYSLPAFLVFLGLILYSRKKRFPVTTLTATLILAGINLITIGEFFGGKQTPSEPWREACQLIRMHQPSTVYVFPPHMSLMLRYYGEDLPMEELIYDSARDGDIQLTSLQANSGTKSVFLVLSHDWGAGDRLIQAFERAFSQSPVSYSLPYIRIFLFRSV